MKETIEHNNRFYGEELKTESEQLKEWLMIANKENEKLHSIIKEVREYTKEMQVYCIEFESWGVPSKELLEILDKLQKLKGEDKE